MLSVLFGGSLSRESDLVAIQLLPVSPRCMDEKVPATDLTLFLVINQLSAPDGVAYLRFALANQAARV